MENQVISLVEALMPRACNVAEAVTSRMHDAGLWSGYRASEGLIGELKLSTLLSFRRPREEHAVLVFRNPRMTGMRHVDWGHPVILEADIIDRYSSHILLDKPVKYKEVIEYEFSKTRNLAQQIMAGLEATLKVGGEVGTEGGIHGVTAKVYAELSARIYGEYQRQWGESVTTTNKASREIEVEGPIRIDYEAVRSRNREQRTIRADCDYEHTVELIDERQGIQPDNRPAIQEIVDSWGEFRNVLQGFAPRHKLIERTDPDGNKFKESLNVGFYEEFIRNPIRGEALESLSKPAEGAIELLVDYDNVLSQDIKIV